MALCTSQDQALFGQSPVRRDFGTLSSFKTWVWRHARPPRIGPPLLSTFRGCNFPLAQRTPPLPFPPVVIVFYHSSYGLREQVNSVHS